jgi:8-oxo-dGTP diphosphatase
MVAERTARDPDTTWMLPGGQVECRESVETALARELTEETGLRIDGTPVLAFVVDITAALDDLVGGWRALTYACDATGDLAPADPDGLILTAEWVDQAGALARLEAVEWYDSAPLRAFLAGSAPAGSHYRYSLTGRRGAVTRSEVEVLESRE